MISLLISFAVLIIGYLVYGKVRPLSWNKRRSGTVFSSRSLCLLSAVSLTYLLMAKEGFQLDQTVSYIAGASAAAVLFAVYLIALIRKNHSVR